MDQVFLDNFISKLNEVVKQLSLIAANDDTKKDAQTTSSIISRDDQQQAEDNDAKQGELVSIDESSAKKLADKINDGFSKSVKSYTDKEEKRKVDSEKKMLSNLDIISKSAAATQKIQEDQLQKQDIESLTKKESKNHVYIAGMDREIISELVDGFSTKKTKEESPGLLSSLSSLLGPLALMVGGGLLALSGPSGIGGIGKLMLKLGEQMFKQAVDGVASIVSRVFSKGYKALETIVGDVLSTSGALLDKIPKVIRDSFVKMRDVIFDSLEGVLKFGEDVIKKIPGVGAVASFFKGLGDKFSKILSKGLKIFKAVPILGDIVNIYFAYEKFQQGDVLGSLLELAGAIPGVGIIADFYSIYRDFTYTEEEKKQQNASVGDFFGRIGEQLSRAWENIKKLPLIQGCLNIIEGSKKIFAGDIVGGLKLLGKGAIKITPQGMVFDSVASVYSWMTSMFTTSSEQQTTAPGSVEHILPEKFDLIGKLKDAVAAKIKDMTALAKTIVSKPVEWAKSMWSSVSSYFASDDEIEAVDSVTQNKTRVVEQARDAIKQQTNAENSLAPKNTANILAQSLGAANDNTLKTLFDDLKKAQLDKADLQVKKIETTNRLLENIIALIKEFNISEVKPTASSTNRVFALQASGPNMLSNARNAGYPI